MDRERIKKDDNGIYILNGVKSEEEQSVFTAETQDGLYQMEDKSWWFQLRASLIETVARRFLKKEVLTIDVGGGNGYTTMKLQENGYKVGVLEPSYTACQHAKQRNLDPVIFGTIDGTENRWKQCMLLDVLEHIEDDAAFMQMMHRELKPGGRLLITVPAMQVLWSSEDEIAGHYRRYNIRMLKKVLLDSGFEVIFCSYFYSFLVIPILIFRVGIEKVGLRKKKKDMTREERKNVNQKQFVQRTSLVNNVLSYLNGYEKMMLGHRKSIPFGTSIICLVRCKK